MACANGALVWDAERDEVIREVGFEPATLSGAIAGLREAVPGVAFALLSARTMFADEGYVALRRKRTAGAELFSDVSQVLASQQIVMVAVRHPRLMADEFVAAASEAFASIGYASFAGAATVDIAPWGMTKTGAVSEEMAEAGCPAGSTVVFGDMPNDLPLFA